MSVGPQIGASSPLGYLSPPKAMPVSYSLSESVLEVTIVGHFTVEEALAAFEQGLATIPSDSKPGVLIDVSRSGEFAGLLDLTRLAGLFGQHADLLSGRIGLLVSDWVRFGLAQQLGVLVEDYGLEAAPFEDRDAAVDWLDAAG